MPSRNNDIAVRKAQAWVLPGLWIAIIPIILLNLVVLQAGQANIICSAGLAAIGNFALMYRDYKRSHEELVRDVGVSGWTIKLRLLALASIVLSAKLVGNLSLHFAREDRNGFVSGLKVFNWFGEQDVMILFGAAILAVLTGTIGKKAETLSTRALKFFGTVSFFTTSYLLLAGMWGREALRAADKIFGISWTDFLPLTLDRQLATIFLYERQGAMVFYTAFVVVPLVWLSIALTRWIRKDSPRPTIAGRGFVVCSYLPLLGASMYSRTDTVLGHWILMWSFSGSSDAQDKGFVACLKSGAPSETSDLKCAQEWEAAWTRELDQTSQDIVKALPQVRRSRFIEQDRTLRKTSLSALREPGDRPGDRFLHVAQRASIVRDLAKRYRQDLRQLRGRR
jgi:hypothetical protein